MSNLSNVIEGGSYFAKVYDAVPDYNEKQSPGSGKYQWEINLAVDTETFNSFKDQGFNAGMKEAGKASYTDKPVITFLKWANDYKGNPNTNPPVMDIDKNPLSSEDRIENGSIVKVQWKAYEYGKTTRYKRPMLVAVQVIEINQPTVAEDEVAF
tara:strand:+ start:1587 stop:2048 length:462 start_codon:yes stop_codon:yes gene_type:complete